MNILIINDENKGDNDMVVIMLEVNKKDYELYHVIHNLR